MRRLIAACGSLVVSLTMLPAPVVASDGLELAIGECRALANVMGVVVDASTLQPLSGALVIIQGAAGVILTDAQGRFTVTGIEPQAGRLAIRVQLNGYATSTMDVPMGTRKVNVPMKSSAVAQGAVRDSRPVAVTGASPAPTQQINGLMGMASTSGVSSPFATADLCLEF